MRRRRRAIGSAQAAGGEEPDWVLDEDAPKSLWLRAERDDDDPDGRTYTVTVRAMDASGNLADTQLQVLVPAATTVAAELDGGWYRFSVPVEPDAPSPPDVLAGLGETPGDWWLFDRRGWLPYLYPHPKVRDFTLGRGYWLATADGGTVQVTGQAADPAQAVEIGLPRGWSIIGCPFTEAVGWDDDHVQVTRGDETVPLTQAVCRGWLWPTIYGWHNQASPTTPATVRAACLGRRFSLNVPINPWWSPGELEPWQGYLVTVRRACTLSITGSVSPADAEATVAEARTPSADDWRVRLVAQVPGFGDISTLLGVGADAPVLTEPHPPIGPGVDLYVRPAGTELVEGSPGNALDLRAQAVQSASWEVVVSAAAAQAPVRITWPDLSELPNDLVAYLVDSAAERRVYMRTQTGYEFTSGAEGSERVLRVEVAPREEVAMITSLSAGSAAGGAEIMFSLSAAAQVEVDVLNIAGRRVRTIVTDRDCEAGITSLAWNCRSDRGVLVPSGAYLVRVTARTEDGAQASRIAPLMLRR